MTRPIEFEIADGISLDFDMIRITYKLYVERKAHIEMNSSFALIVFAQARHASSKFFHPGYVVQF